MAVKQLGVAPSGATDPATIGYLQGLGLHRGVTSITSSATPSCDVSLYQQLNITALAAAITSLSSGLSGTMQDGWPFVVRIKDNGTARAIALGSTWRVVGVTAPTTTVVSKTLYLGGKWNAADSVIDLLAVGQQS